MQVVTWLVVMRRVSLGVISGGVVDSFELINSGRETGDVIMAARFVKLFTVKVEYIAIEKVD